MKINKEGYRIILLTICVYALICAACFLWTPRWLAWIVAALALGETLFIMAFFREPERSLRQDESIVYSPADGEIVVIEEVEENEFLGERRIQISVFMSLTNVHINWFPVGGTVVYKKYHPGKFLVAWHPKSSQKNERMTVVVDTGRHTVLYRQIAGFIARRIVSYAEEGKRVEQNEKSGFIRFGSRVDLMLPLGSEILVRLGDKVTGSQTPLARLK